MLQHDVRLPSIIPTKTNKTKQKNPQQLTTNKQIRTGKMHHHEIASVQRQKDLTVCVNDWQLNPFAFQLNKNISTSASH